VESATGRRSGRPPSEYVVFFGTMAVLFALDWRKALLFFVIPQQVALFAIQCVNYQQHVETDADSEWKPLPQLRRTGAERAALQQRLPHRASPQARRALVGAAPSSTRSTPAGIHPSLLERSWPRYFGRTFPG